MDITYLGQSSFKIKTKSATVVTDPFDSKFLGIKFPSTEGDIVTISHDHGDHNNSEVVSNSKKVITGPGEYEVMGVSIIGIGTFHDGAKGEERGKNTIYIIEAEGLRIAHLGDLGHDLDTHILDQIGAIDILLVPVGGHYTINSKEASSVVSKIDPYYIIPMHYKVDGMRPDISANLEPVDNFLKETGLPVENLPKFSLKKDEIGEDQNEKIVVLERK